MKLGIHKRNFSFVNKQGLGSGDKKRFKKSYITLKIFIVLLNF